MLIRRPKKLLQGEIANSIEIKKLQKMIKVDKDSGDKTGYGCGERS